jgi:hypothetical protein
MKSKDHVIGFLAGRQFDKYMGGEQNYYVDCSMAVYIFEDPNIPQTVNLCFKMLLDRHYAKAKSKK